MKADNITNVLNFSAFSTDNPDALNDGFLSASSRAVKFTIILIISTTIVFSNIINIFTLPKVKQIPFATRVFLLNLSSADLCVGLIVCLPCTIPALIGSWPYGAIWCQIAGLTHASATSASVWCIGCVSIERYLAIVYPVKYKQHVNDTRCFVVAVLIWVFSTAVYLLGIFFTPGFMYFKFYIPYTMCGFYWEYKWLIIIASAVYPYTSGVCIISCTYKTIKALKKVRPVNVETGSTMVQNGYNTTTRRREERAIRLVTFTAFGYVVFISPYCVVANFVVFHPNSANIMPVWVEFVTMWLVNCNSFMNVIIYSSIFPAFRSNIKKMLRSLFYCSRQPLARETGHDAFTSQTRTTESVNM